MFKRKLMYQARNIAALGQTQAMAPWPDDLSMAQLHGQKSKSPTFLRESIDPWMFGDKILIESVDRGMGLNTGYVALEEPAVKLTCLLIG